MLSVSFTAGEKDSSCFLHIVVAPVEIVIRNPAGALPSHITMSEFFNLETWFELEHNERKATGVNVGAFEMVPEG